MSRAGKLYKQFKSLSRRPAQRTRAALFLHLCSVPVWIWTAAYSNWTLTTRSLVIMQAHRSKGETWFYTVILFWDRHAFLCVSLNNCLPGRGNYHVRHFLCCTSNLHFTVAKNLTGIHCFEGAGNFQVVPKSFHLKIRRIKVGLLFSGKLITWPYFESCCAPKQVWKVMLHFTLISLLF